MRHRGSLQAARRRNFISEKAVCTCSASTERKLTAEREKRKSREGLAARGFAGKTSMGRLILRCNFTKLSLFATKIIMPISKRHSPRSLVSRGFRHPARSIYKLKSGRCRRQETQISTCLVPGKMPSGLQHVVGSTTIRSFNFSHQTRPPSAK